MRGYKIGDTGIIEEVYEKAPKGSKSTYEEESGVYLESAVNKLIARSVRYQEFMRNKQKIQELAVTVVDMEQELDRVRNVLGDSEAKVREVSAEIKGKEDLVREAEAELEGIRKEISEALGGVK